MSAAMNPICPCDGDVPAPPTNLPSLSTIAYRNGTFREFRRALLTPLLPAPGAPPVEGALSAWRSGVGADPSVPDLGVMMVEWWAYLADILTFYNERIANEDYLRTGKLPESAGRLISILGYRPRPALGATGTLAALVTPGQTATLPKGLQFQSKPGPGQEPQTFELDAPTAIFAPDAVAAIPPPVLVSEAGAATTFTRETIFGMHQPEMFYRGMRTPWLQEPIPVFTTTDQILLRGTVTTVSSGALLLLGPRDDTTSPTLIMVSGAPVPRTVTGGKQTELKFTVTGGAALAPMTAANARLQHAAQSIALWTVNSGTVDTAGTTIQLAGLARQIRTHDWVVFTAPGVAQPQLVRIVSSVDVLGDASAAGTAIKVSAASTAIPVLHTALTLADGLDGTMIANPSAVTVLFGWVEVGTLIDQPPAAWDGTSPGLVAVQPAMFANGTNVPIIVQDAAGAAVAAIGSSGGDGDLSVWPATPVPLSPPLQPPFQVYYNLLPVSRGKTIANEVLGSGDATIAGQSFMLANSPVTYLANGAGYASTIALTVNGVPWKEVSSFYGQSSNAKVFVTREDDQASTHVDFGDGVNGARLPSGTNNVVATYRIGAGAASPPAGKLTVIAQAWPGLRTVQNPVAVNGGSDPDPPALLQQDAPRSVLTFGRAVSIDDYQALAALASGVTRASAVWTWDRVNRRAGVTVYVAGTGDVVSTATAVLAAAGDPNRPVTIVAATPLLVTLVLTLIVTPGMDTKAIAAAVTAALTDPATGLFAPANLGIGQTVFDSQIEASCLSVSGVVALSALTFYVAQDIDPGPLHVPGEGAFYLLTADGVSPSTQADPNG